MFGSVPLRTYLPDGDIDISMFFPLHGSGPSDPLKDTWGTQLLKALERESGRRDAPFRIRNCQIIQAEFKLVKFVVADVVVDVSFNALGGLCTVAFLEWADRTIGRNHLFKRSIVLIKAWCYYESRLLGAHHGLFSSYALEAMVLYVFNWHGASLYSPLQVLHRFLKEFGAFEWDKYALSLLGPIELSSLPHPRLAKEAMPQTPSLLDPREMQDAVERYSVQPAAAVAALDALLDSLRAGKSNSSSSGEFSEVTVALPQKYLNIMDPLLPTNNLGRSVSKASFTRIKRALAFGAEQLERILQLEPLAASEGIAAYFENTWRSPMRMAADNQAFQSQLSMGSAMLQGNRRRGTANGAGHGNVYRGAVAPGSSPQRPMVRRLSSASLPDLPIERMSSTGTENQRIEGEGSSRSQASSVVASPPRPQRSPAAPLPPPPLPLPHASPSDTYTSSHPSTPRMSPRVVPMATQSAPPIPVVNATAPWIVGAQPGAMPATFVPINYAVQPSTSAEGSRTVSYHASLPTSPVLMPATVVGLSARPMDTRHVPGNAGPLPIPVAPSRDIFMADLDNVLANLDLARDWQPRTTPTSTTNGTGNQPRRSTGDSTPSRRRSSDRDPPQPIAQTRQLTPDALEAAMASLPPVRVSSLSALDSYASVTAQGLTPLTVPNSRAASLASAASSAANTPKDGQRSGYTSAGRGAGSPRQGPQPTNFYNSRPPLPGRVSSGTSTPTTTSPSGIPPMLPRQQQWSKGGVGASSVSGGSANVSTTASPSTSKPPSPQAATTINASTFTANGTLPPIAVPGRALSSSAAAVRPPSRLGGLRSGSPSGPPPVPAPAELPSDPMVSSLDVWPAIAKSEAGSAAAGGGSLTGSVWGSVPPSVRSGNSTPAMSPRAGSWVGTAAASPVKQASPAKLPIALLSPRRGLPPPPSSPARDPKFKLKKDEFPSLK